MDALLSPIQELSDLDISFLLNQLSSASGDISDKTIEEIIREAEAIASPVATAPPKPGALYSQKEMVPDPTKSNLNITSSNVFKVALDNITEVTNKLTARLAVEEKTNVGNKNDAKKQPEKVTSLTKTNMGCNKSTINAKPPEKILRKQESATFQKINFQKHRKSFSHCLPKNKTQVKVEIEAVKNIEPRVNRPKRSFVPTSSKCSATRIYSTKSPKKAATVTRFERKKDVQYPLNVTYRAGQRSHNLVNNLTTSKSTIKDCSCCTSVNIRQLNDENSRLKLQIKEIEEKCDLQIKKLVEKCSKLEQNQILVPSNIIARQEMVEVPCRFDACCQTDQEHREIATQSAEPIAICSMKEKESNGKKLTHKTENLAQTVQTINVGNIDFGFQNLDLDNNFVPWQKTIVSEKNSADTSKTSKSSNLKNGRHFRANVEPRNADTQLLATIRGLQSELERAKRDVQRFKSELATSKVKKVDRFKSVIRRTIGTQTIGFAASTEAIYNPDLFQVSKVITEENETLKMRLRALESSMQDIKAKRLQDLMRLQQKHEEEVSILLEQKLCLANKLDAALARPIA